MNGIFWREHTSWFYLDFILFYTSYPLGAYFFSQRHRTIYWLFEVDVYLVPQTLYCLTGHWQMRWKLKEGGVNYVQFNKRFKGNSPEEKKNGATF